MNRTSEFRRAARRNHINRKKRIIKDQHNYWNYKFEGELDKGKIHCSCWIYCNWYRFEHNSKYRYKFSDYRKIFKMEQQKKDFDFCLKCFWAHPEEYDHVAGHIEKVVSIIFTNDEIEDYNKLISLAGEKTAQETIKEILHRHLN